MMEACTLARAGHHRACSTGRTWTLTKMGPATVMATFLIVSATCGLQSVTFSHSTEQCLCARLNNLVARPRTRPAPPTDPQLALGGHASLPRRGNLCRP